MFGIKLDDRNRKEMASVVADMLREGKKEKKKGRDQVLLRQHLYQHVKDDAAIHDSYLCKNVSAEESPRFSAFFKI